MVFPLGKLRTSNKLLKVLASDRKFNILAQLMSQRKTVTDLSKELDIPKSTTYDNLVVLVDFGLVKKNKGNKWVYYELTTKGRKIIQNFISKSPITPH